MTNPVSRETNGDSADFVMIAEAARRFQRM
jgi:hypothetical protein